MRATAATAIVIGFDEITLDRSIAKKFIVLGILHTLLDLTDTGKVVQQKCY